MKAFVWLLTMVVLLLLVPGCGNDKDRGMNRHKDMPRAGTTEAEKK